MQPSNSLSILSIISSNRVSGPGAAALQQAMLLAEAGHKVTFACLEGKNLAERARAVGLEVDTGLSFPRKGELWRLPGDIRYIRDILNQKQIKLVMTHQTIDTLAGAIAVKGKTPMLRIYHNGSDKPLSWPNRCFFNLFPLVVIATSPAGGRALGTTALAPDGGRVVLPGAVNSTDFNPDLDGSAIRKDLGFRNEDIVVGIVARWKKGRGLTDFLNAFAQATKKEPRLRALLIGRGEARKLLEAEAKALNISESVVFCSPQGRFREALAAVDIGALMRPGSDGTARAALEMMAMGCPLALMRSGSLADFEGIPGQPATIICGNPEEMTAALIKYASDATLREIYSNNARAEIESSHTLAHLYVALEDLCARAVSQQWGIKKK